MSEKAYPNSEKLLQGLLRFNKAEEDRSCSSVVRKVLSYIPQSTEFQLPEANANLLSSEKALLTRKANELFRIGQIQAAEKIFLTVGYSAGLHKLAEHYFRKNDFLRAYLLFQAAHNNQQTETLSERFAAVLQKWLKK